MEGIESFHTYLKNYQHQAGILAEAAGSLSKSLEVEASRLTREDGVRCLKAIHAAVAEELEATKRLEIAASYEHTKANLPFGVVGFFAKIIMAATTEKPPTLKLVSQVCDTSIAKKRPYGTVMLCVGPKGLPDDARVVSISGLARESNRSESETTQELRRRGYLLFNQEAFSRLIDKLVIDIQGERLHLPIPIETLKGAETLRFEASKAVWVRLSRPQ